MRDKTLATPRRPAADKERALAPLPGVVEVPGAPEVEVPLPPAGAPLELVLAAVIVPPLVVLLEMEWLAAFWKAAYVLLAVGLMANTIPFWQ